MRTIDAIIGGDVTRCGVAGCGMRTGRCRKAATARRGMLLVVVLAIISVMALLGGSFAFRMNSQVAATTAVYDQQQAMLAAESGLDRVVQVLRSERTNVDAWYNNQEAFRRVLVWAQGEIGGSVLLADQEKVEGRPAWRFSVPSYVIDDTGRDEARMRYGVTDEASKINLRTASRGQLLALFDQFEITNVSPEQLADALADWQDTDDEMISINGAESNYYVTLHPAFKAKNRSLQTVDELLMVKGFNGRILYGEDYNRNGWLDENEDDGEDGAFPPDNGDGELDRGLLPLVTTHSWDWDFGNDNKPRLPLGAIRSLDFLEEEKFAYLLEDGITEEIIQFIVDANSRMAKKKRQWKSVGELLGIEVYENGTTSYDEAWAEHEALKAAADADRLEKEEKEEAQEEEGDEGPDINPEDLEEFRDGEEIDLDGGGMDEEEEVEGRGKGSRNEQSRRDGGEGGGGGDTASDTRWTGGSSRNPAGGGRSRRGGDRLSGLKEREEETPEKEEDPGEPLFNPITPEDMSVLMDRFTASDSPITPLVGLINVNTASPSVLKTIPGLSQEDVASIVSARAQLEGEEKASLGWLAAHGVLDEVTFALVSNMLTTRSIQFHVEVIGFADHVGTFKRIEAVVEFRGRVAQIRYFRDISSLGMGYPVFDDERSEGLAFSDF